MMKSSIQQHVTVVGMRVDTETVIINMYSRVTLQLQGIRLLQIC